MATAIAERRVHPVQAFSEALELRSDQFKMALPAHITVDRFKRTAITAAQNNPDLLDGGKVDRASLMLALVKAASSGMLPDGREGAIVPFKGKAAWMPMVHGIMKVVRNSGEIASWDVAAVFEKDKFQRLLGDDQRLYHEPYDEGDPGEVVGAYSIVTFKDGTKSRDYMPRWRIERARNQGMAKNSLQWTTFYDEGAIKTVIKHHAKRLPQSTDVDGVLQRDDFMRERVEPQSAALPVAAQEPARSGSRLDQLEARIAPAGDDDYREGRADEQHGDQFSGDDEERITDAMADAYAAEER